MEDQLKVGQRVVARGGARVYSRLVEEPVEDTVRIDEAVQAHDEITEQKPRRR